MSLFQFGDRVRYATTGEDGFPDKIINGEDLDDEVFGDGDADGFIDFGNEYDVTVSLRNQFTLAPNDTTTYVTTTIWGTGAPTELREPGILWVTLDRPKPLVELQGRALLDWALDRLADTGIERVVVNTHYLADMIERAETGNPFSYERLVDHFKDYAYIGAFLALDDFYLAERTAKSVFARGLPVFDDAHGACWPTP